MFSLLSRLFDEELFIKTAIDCSLLWHIKNCSVKTAAEVFYKTLVEGKRTKVFMRRSIESFLRVRNK